MVEFTCNLCGAANRCARTELDRERPSCSKCGSNVRTRGLLLALSVELFSTELVLPDFPRVKSLRGLGASDSGRYAETLAARLDYRNTFHDREPRLDLAAVPQSEHGAYDFLIASEVLEHVPPPASAAFTNACLMLKPHGFLVFTTPYSLDPATAEHFPALHEFGLARVGESLVLVNRTREGTVQVFDKLVFHRSPEGDALEMREFSESGLRGCLAEAGFESVRICAEDYPPFGVLHSESWSLPVVARRGPFAWTAGNARELVEQYRDIRHKLDSEMERLCRSLWFRAGRKLGLL